MFWTRLISIALLLSLLIVPTQAQGQTLSGTVTYRERIALPADAQLRVTLVRLPGANPVAGASTAIPAKGAVPLAFSLNLHNGLVADASFSLLAEISSQGRILFRNADPVPVRGTGEPIAILVQFTEPWPEPAPSLPQPAPAPDPFLDLVWTVTSIGGRPVTGERPLTLSIAADHRVGGSAGCNNYFAEATIDESALTFSPAAATRMACAPDIMAQEAAYLAALAAVGAYELDNTSLRLLDAAGIPLVGLVRDAE